MTPEPLLLHPELQTCLAGRKEVFTPTEWKLWYRDEANAMHRILVPRLDKVITHVLQLAALGRKARKVAVVYPTPANNLLLPVTIGLGYSLIAAQARNEAFNSLVAWTPDPDFGAHYQATFIGNHKPEQGVNQQWPLATQTPGERKVRSAKPGLPKPKAGASPVVFLSGQHGIFSSKLADGVRPLALVVDANHRYATQNYEAIQTWATNQGCRLIVYLLANPFHPVLRQLDRDGWLVLGWSPEETQEETSNQKLDKTPYSASLAPLQTLNSPNHQFIMNSVVDGITVNHLKDIQSWILQCRPSSSDGPHEWMRYNFMRSLFQKMLTLAVPLPLHEKHFVGTYSSLSIPRQLEKMERLAEALRNRSQAEAAALDNITSRGRQFLHQCRLIPTGKARELERLAREATGRVIIGVDTHNERVATAEFLSSIGKSDIPVERMQDLQGTTGYDELWLLGAPAIHKLDIFRAGVAPTIRILVYDAVERDRLQEFIQVSSLPTLHTNHEKAMMENAADLTGCARPKTIVARARRSPRIIHGGKQLADIDWATILQRGQRVQKVVGNTARGAPDAVPQMPELQEPIAAKERITVYGHEITRGDVTYEFSTKDFVLRLDESEGHLPVRAFQLKVGDKVLLSTRNARENVLDNLFDQLEDSSREISIAAFNSRQWHEQLRQYRDANGLRNEDLLRKLQSVTIGGQVTRITSDEAIDAWIRGYVIGPADDNDLRRLAAITGTPISDGEIDAIHQVRTLHRQVMNQIMRVARKGDWTTLVWSDKLDIEFDGFSELFEVVTITRIQGGRNA